MLFSTIAFLAIATSLAAAAPPAAQATYCSEDNLLRAFQHTPTPASKYCATDTGYPTFLAVTSYPATRLSSACSCFSRIPSETTAAPACTPSTKFSISGTLNNGIQVNLVITASPTTSCAGGYIAVTNVCGTYDGGLVSFNPADALAPECLGTIPTNFIDVLLYFRTSTGHLVLLNDYNEQYYTNDITQNDGARFFTISPAVFTDVSCSGSSTCPTV